MMEQEFVKSEINVPENKYECKYILNLIFKTFCVSMRPIVNNKC